MTPPRSARRFAAVLFLFVALLLARLPAPAADPVKWDPARTTAPETPAELKALQDAVHGVVEKCGPATVNVKIFNEVSFKGKKGINLAQGSGVIVSPDGLVLTAAHVISPERPAAYKAGREVTLAVKYGDKMREDVKGTTLGVNRDMDSGMIQITTKGPDDGKWPFVKVARSADLKKGQWLVTLGHPGGYEPGRPPVARLGRYLGIVDYIHDIRMSLIRTDTTIVGGDSGGPLFDLAGNLVGIHSQIGPPLNVNLHVATDTFRDDWDAMLAGESLPFPTKLGVEFAKERKSGGVLIKEAPEDEPAAAAGMKDGDLIVSFDGKKVAHPDDIRLLLGRRKPDTEVPVVVKRGDETVTLKVKLGKK